MAAAWQPAAWLGNNSAKNGNGSWQQRNSVIAASSKLAKIMA